MTSGNYVVDEISQRVLEYRLANLPPKKVLLHPAYWASFLRYAYSVIGNNETQAEELHNTVVKGGFIELDDVWIGLNSEAVTSSLITDTRHRKGNLTFVFHGEE